MKLKRRNIYLEFIIGIVVIYLSVLILLFIFQRSLMYHPLENNYSGDKLEVEVEKVKIVTSDNIKLLGWFHKKDLNKFKMIVTLTGNKKEIYQLARKSYLVVKEDGDGGPHDMIHTENFVLVDKQKRIRGYYDGTQAAAMDDTLRDIAILIAEK